MILNAIVTGFACIGVMTAASFLTALALRLLNRQRATEHEAKMKRIDEVGSAMVNAAIQEQLALWSENKTLADKWSERRAELRRELEAI